MRNKKGLTLVEVVVAMGLFGVIMVTLFPAFLITNLMNITSREFTDANFMAQTELEEIYDRSDDTTVTKPASYLVTLGYTCTGPETTGSCKKSDTDYLYTVTFSQNTQVNTMYNLLITVTKPTGHPDYGKDRAQLELVLKFGSTLTP